MAVRQHRSTKSKADEFARRRAQLMRMMGRGGIAILPAAPVRHRNSDVEYAYRQDSDFLYLTGFEEPGSVAVLIPESNLKIGSGVRTGAKVPMKPLRPQMSRG